MNEPERRLLRTDPPKATGRQISGIAARFNTRSENLGTAARPFHEIILPGAFDDVLRNDVIACVNHDEKMILARSRDGTGTLSLWVDEIGLRYSFEAPQTTAGNDILESIKRADIDASSFAFSIAENGDTYAPEGGGTLRTICEVGRLFDVSPVSRAAYPSTIVSVRSLSVRPPESFSAVSIWSRFFDILR